MADIIDIIKAVKGLAVDFGTATSAAAAGSSGLVDAGKNWAPGMHRDRLVRVVDGAGVGQLRVIADNSENTLVTKTPWARPLDATSVYVILNQGAEALVVDIALLLARIGWEGGTPLADKLTDARAALIDQVTALRMAELDAANLPADIDTLKAAVGDPSADTLTSLRDKLGDLQRDLYLMLDEIGRWDAAGSLSTDIVSLLNDVGVLLLDVGAASGSALGSLYAILGNPAQSLSAMVGYQGATSLADKLTAARAALLDQITALRMGELDAANLPADVDALKAAIPVITPTTTYTPSLQDTEDIEPATRAIAANAEAVGLGNADYSRPLTLAAPASPKILVKSLVSRLQTTVDSMNAGCAHLYVRVYVDAQAPDNLLFDADITGIGADLHVQIMNATTKATLFNLIRDGAAHTFYWFMWVDAGNAVVSLVQLWEGVGATVYNSGACVQIDHAGMASIYAEIERKGSGSATAQWAYYGTLFPMKGEGFSPVYCTYSGLIDRPLLEIWSNVATDIVVCNKVAMVLRSN